MSILEFAISLSLDKVNHFILDKHTENQYINICKLIHKHSLYKYGNLIVHNGETLTAPAVCVVCADDCTEYADCMYSNCRHLCVCYNCMRKMDNKDRTQCIICRQYNDCIIQILKP